MALRTKTRDREDLLKRRHRRVLLVLGIAFHAAIAEARALGGTVARTFTV